MHAEHSVSVIEAWFEQGVQVELSKKYPVEHSVHTAAFEHITHPVMQFLQS